MHEGQLAAIRDHLDWCRQQRERSLEMLKNFEAGINRIGHIGGQGYIDDSARFTEQLRGSIETMDRLIAAYEKSYPTLGEVGGEGKG